MTLGSKIGVLGELGPRGIAEVVRERAWSESRSFGLACDLRHLPPAFPTEIEVVMLPCAPRSFAGFAEELSRVSGGDYLEVEQRMRFCQAGVEGLHVATDPEGRPIYAQWLVDSDNQSALHAATHGQFPNLTPDEALVEGAYTFLDFRQMRAFVEGGRQLLAKAAEHGASRCYTYISFGNVPSLRGAARVGLILDHTRVTTFRAGRRRVVRRPPLPAERTRWEEATAPRQPATTA